MKHKVGLALGSIYRTDIVFVREEDANRDGLITKCREIDAMVHLDAVELTVGTYGQVLNLHISPSNIKWLTGVPYRSIHAPCIKRTTWDGSTTIRVLDAIAMLYKEIRADCIIFHPNGPPPHEWVRETNCHIAIENLGKADNVVPEALRDLIDEYEDASFCFDLSHALEWGKSHSLRLLSMLAESMCQVHISGFFDGVSHQRLSFEDQAICEVLNALKGYSAPYIIEEDLKTKNAAIQEIRKLKQFLLKGRA